MIDGDALAQLARLLVTNKQVDLERLVRCVQKPEAFVRAHAEQLLAGASSTVPRRISRPSS
jgi:hypothetical protein